MRIGANIKINLQREGGKQTSLVLEKKGRLTYLEHLIGRLKQLPQLQIVLTATPSDDCDELKKIARRENLPVFFDAETDRHRRLQNAINTFKLDAMLDIPAIFSAISVHHTQKMIIKHVQTESDITLPINFPNGAAPLSILSPTAVEKIIAADFDKPYYKDFDQLPEDLTICDYSLESQRTFFETRFVLFSKRDQARIDYLLEQQTTSCEGERNLYSELNIKDKLEILLQPANHFIIEPTNHCNLRCIGCTHGENTMVREKGFMKLEDFKKIAGHLPRGSRIALFGLGESFINKNIYHMINACDGIHPYISTNGHYFHSKKNKLNLIDSQLERLILAIDGASEETYSKYRKRGMFTRIIKDTKELIELRNSLGKKKPRFEMQFILFKFNEHEVEKAKTLANDLGMDDIYFKTTMGELEGATVKRERKDRRIQYTKGAASTPLSVCLRPAVTWKGELSPCCHLFHNQLILGNLIQQSSEEIKNSAVYREFAERRAALEEDACAERECYCYS